MTPLAISPDMKVIMPLNPRPLHGEHAHPAEGDSGFQAWSSQVGDGSAHAGRDQAPLFSTADFSHPYVKVAVAAFIGYTLAKLIHRRG